jgi:hypothetical protein
MAFIHLSESTSCGGLPMKTDEVYRAVRASGMSPIALGTRTGSAYVGDGAWVRPDGTIYMGDDAGGLPSLTEW